MSKTVAVYFLSNLDINEYACKFAILSLNSKQTYFEFEFPNISELNIKKETYFPKVDVCEADLLFQNFSKLISDVSQKPNVKADYYIGIINARIGKDDDLFWSTQANKAIITTKGWDRVFSPPSVIEYLIQSIAGILMVISSNNSNKPIVEHSQARGCILDYAYDKMENKVDVSLGYICSECKAKIKSVLGDQFLKAIEVICSPDCLGDVETAGTIAHNLKKFYKVDINKDSGFNKTAWEKTKESFADLPKEIILVAVTGLVTGLVAVIVYLLTSYRI